jgi:dihydrofolate reductase
MSSIKKCIVVAFANDRVIGVNNTLPWHLPEDLKHFKALTLGHPMIMGRMTYDSIGRPLPGRETIVVTRNESWSVDSDHVSAVTSLDAAIELGESHARRMGVDRMMIVGGAGIYRQSLPICDELYVTQLDLDVDGDAYFPEIDFEQWRLENCSDYVSEGDAKIPYSFLDYRRKRS